MYWKSIKISTDLTHYDPRVVASGLRSDDITFLVGMPTKGDADDSQEVLTRLDTYRDCVCRGIVTCDLHVRLVKEWAGEYEERKSFRNPVAVKGGDRTPLGVSVESWTGREPIHSATAVDEFDPIPASAESAKDKFSHPQIKGWPELDGSARRKLREVNALIDLYRREFGRIAGDQIFERTVKVVIE